MSKRPKPEKPQQSIRFENLREAAIKPLDTAMFAVQSLHEKQQRKRLKRAATLGRFALEIAYEVIEKPVAYKTLLGVCKKDVESFVDREFMASSMGPMRITHDEIDATNFYKIEWQSNRIEQVILSSIKPVGMTMAEFIKHTVVISDNLQAFEYSQNCTELTAQSIQGGIAKHTINSTRAHPVSARTALQLSIDIAERAE